MNDLEITLPIYESSKVKAYHKYDDYLSYRGANPTPEEINDWLERKKQADLGIDLMIQEIEKRRNEIKLVDYFRYFDKLLDLEEKYKIRLSSGILSPLEKNHRACFTAMAKNGNSQIAEEDLPEKERFYINAVRDRHAWLHDIPVSKKGELSINYLAAFSWLVKKYLLIMFFWFLIYIIRFQEKEKSIYRFKRHHHELNKFINDQEPYPGHLSLKEELLLCPERFLLRVLLWPFFCWKYPIYETTAEMVRYNRLKAEYLRYQPVGYQLSDREEIILRSKARAPVKDFAKTVRGIREFKITPLMVRKSLATAYLSLFLGVMFQPAIVFAAKNSEKVNNFFHGSVQIVKIDYQFQYFDNGIDPPQNDNNFSPPTISNKFTLEILWTEWKFVIIPMTSKLKEIIREIFHIPLTRLFFGAAEAYKPLTV